MAAVVEEEDGDACVAGDEEAVRRGGVEDDGAATDPGGDGDRSMGSIPPIQSGGQREERGVGRGSGASGVGLRSRVSGGWGIRGTGGGPAWVGWFGGQLGRSAQLARGVSSFFCYFFVLPFIHFSFILVALYFWFSKI